MSFYVIIYILFSVASLAYIGRHIYRMLYKGDKKESNPENIYTWNLAGINLYRIYGMVKGFTSCKTTIFLLGMAKKGHIKIRDNADEMYIDKAIDFDNVEPTSSVLMHALFDDKSTSYADEGVIMPVTTVAWKDVANKYRSVVGRIVKDNKKPKTKSRKINQESDDSYSWLGDIGAPLFMMWVIMGLAFATAFRIANPSENFVLMMSHFALYTCFFITIPFVAFVIDRKLFPKLAEMYLNFGSLKGIAQKLFSGFWLVVLILIFLAFFGAGLCSAIFYWFFVVVSAGGTPFVYINLFLYLVGILVSVAYIVIQSRGIKLHKETTITDIVNMAITTQDIDKAKLDKADADNLYLLSHILERRDIVDALEQEMDDSLEWYIGENFDGVEAVLKKLDDIK